MMNDYECNLHLIISNLVSFNTFKKNKNDGDDSSNINVKLT